MNMPKINLIENIVGNLTIDIKKLFDKGEIDKLYSKMYQVADELSAAETKRYMAKRGAELQELLLKRAAKRLTDGKEGSYDDKEPARLRSVKPLANYKNRRLKIHLDYMCHLLELYVKSKTRNRATDSRYD